jgi:exosortase
MPRRIAILLLLGIGFERVYRSTLTGLVREWMSSPEASYGLLLAATALAVAMRRWRPFVSASTADGPSTSLRAGRDLGGFGLAACGAAVFVAGQLGADVFLTRLSFVMILAGSVWSLAGGTAARIMAAPLFFLLIAIPLPALVINEITLPLQLAASQVAETALTAGSIPVYRDGNLLLLPSATLQVAEACSGLRSAVSLGGVGVLLAWANEPTLPRRALLVVLTLPIAVVMNGLRVAATGVYTESAGQPPGGDLHSFMGWVTFVVSIALLMGVQRLSWSVVLRRVAGQADLQVRPTPSGAA